MLPRQVDTVVCVAQAQLLGQTLVPVPPPYCQGPPSLEGAPGQQGPVPCPPPQATAHSRAAQAVHFTSQPLAPSLSTLPACPALLCAGLQPPSLLAVGQGLYPSHPPPLHPAAPRALPEPNAALRSLPAGTKADELNLTPVTCSPPSSKACLLPLLQHGALCGSGRGEERAGECTGAGSMGQHAGELGQVSTGAFGSWEPSTSCTAHSVPPVQPPA